jgi:hypothetical protein
MIVNNYIYGISAPDIAIEPGATAQLFPLSDSETLPAGSRQIPRKYVPSGVSEGMVRVRVNVPLLWAGAEAPIFSAISVSDSEIVLFVDKRKAMLKTPEARFPAFSKLNSMVTGSPAVATAGIEFTGTENVGDEEHLLVSLVVFFHI